MCSFSCCLIFLDFPKYRRKSFQVAIVPLGIEEPSSSSSLLLFCEEIFPNSDGSETGIPEPSSSSSSSSSSFSSFSSSSSSSLSSAVSSSTASSSTASSSTASSSTASSSTASLLLSRSSSPFPRAPSARRSYPSHSLFPSSSSSSSSVSSTTVLPEHKVESKHEFFGVDLLPSGGERIKRGRELEGNGDEERPRRRRRGIPEDSAL